MPQRRHGARKYWPDTMGPFVCPVHLHDGALCGQPTPCPVHPSRGAAHSHARTRRARQPAASDHNRDALRFEAPLAGRDLNALGWWLIEQVLSGDTQAPRDQFAIAATLMRVLAAVGPGLASKDEANRETALRARLLHARLPRDEAEWALARSLFDDEALGLIQALALLGEGDGGYGGQPLRWLEGGADEVDLPRVGEYED